MSRVLICLLVACASGGEERSTLDSIPKAAAATVRQQAGGMKIEKVDRENEDGAEVYEATWYANGVRHEAKVTANGVLLELEVEVAEKDVPVVVKETAERQLGKGVRYVRLMKGDYEAEIEVGGVEKEVVIAANGSLVDKQDDDDEEDDD